MGSAFSQQSLLSKMAKPSVRAPANLFDKSASTLDRFCVFLLYRRLRFLCTPGCGCLTSCLYALEGAVSKHCQYYDRTSATIVLQSFRAPTTMTRYRRLGKTFEIQGTICKISLIA